MDDTTMQMLDLAQAILNEEGYSTDRVSLESGSELLLGENHFFIVGVAAAPRISDLETLETEVGDYLADLVGSSNIGAKRWDVYLVLLSREVPDEDSDDDTILFDLAYSTRMFRRIVRVGVVATAPEIASALGSFLPLRSVSSPDISRDPLSLLEDELAVHGIDPETATRAIAEFRQNRSVTNV